MNILVVDANKESAEIIQSSLEEQYPQVFIASSFEDARPIIERHHISLVLIDWYLSDDDASTLCTWLRDDYVDRYVYRLVVIDNKDLQSLPAAFDAGADDVVHNSVEPEELDSRLGAAKRLIDSNANLSRKNHRLVASFDQLMQDFMEVTTDLADAGRVQKCLLPTTTSFNNFQAHGILRPATQLSGDSFDFFRLNQRYLAFYIADAVGHGSASAMVSYAVHHQIKPRAHGICISNLQKASSLEETIIGTVNDLNEQFVADSSETNRWFTMIYGLIDLTNGAVTLCQAGQPPALHYSHSTGEIQEIGTGGFPVGLFEEANYTTSHCVLEAGDKLLMCSDGAFECKNTENAEFGVDNLKRVMEESSTLDLPDTAVSITSELIDWNGGETFTDDLSVLLFQHAA